MKSFVLVAIVCGATLVGCGSESAQVVDVSGKVTRNGKPVPFIYLNFVPESGRQSWGMTDEQGNFKLSYDKDHEGAVVGKHSVWVQLRARSPKDELELPSRLKNSPDLRAILDKYGDRQKTPLRVEIAAPVSDLQIKLD